MTRDYKNSRARPERRSHGWAWFLTGLTLGLSVAVAVHLNGRRALQEMAAASTQRPPARPAPPKPRPAASEPKRSFDFYALLPELEVVVPDEADSRPAAAPKATRPAPVPAKTPKAPARQTGAYLLQVGSFQRYEEADSLKAKLALLGVHAHIQTVRVNQDTWHRVRLGPYKDLAEANRVRERLRKRQVKALLLRVRG